MATKEELIKEINTVLAICSKYDMKNPEHVNKVLDFLSQKNYFLTDVGDRYIKRLKELKSGSADKKCFICKKNDSYDGAVCEACMNRFSNGNTTFYSKRVGKTHLSIEKTKNQGKYESVKAIIKAIAEKGIKWWKARKKWQKIVVITVAILLLLGIVGSGSGNLSGSSVSSGPAGVKISSDTIQSSSGYYLEVDNSNKEYIHNKDEASEYIQFFFSESDGWLIYQVSESAVVQGNFWTPINRNTGYSETAVQEILKDSKGLDSDLIQSYYSAVECYYAFATNTITHENVNILVSKTGRLLAGEDLDYLYRYV